MVTVSIVIGACSVPDWANPVEWYRDATGVSQDDPGPDARNTQNLEKGGEEPYPNLASVPPPPTNALSAAEREKLRNSLAADRANAKYVDNNDQYVAVPPQVMPSPPLNAPEPAGQPETATAPAAPVQATPVPASSAPRPAASPAPTRGTEAPPQESPLTPPSVRSVPQGETPRSPPPPPANVPVRAQTQPSPMPQPPGAASAPPQTAALPPMRASTPPPAFGGASAATPSGVGVTLGTISFAGNSAKLSPQTLAQIREVATLRDQTGGGTIRVTGYSEPQGEQNTMAPQLASFSLALDRARAVAAALALNGVPLRSVEIGASPPPPGQPGGVVEMSLEQ